MGNNRIVQFQLNDEDGNVLVARDVDIEVVKYGFIAWGIADHPVIGASERAAATALLDAVAPFVRVPSLHRKMLRAIENYGALEMRIPHTCETTHCRAGWAAILLGPIGLQTERQLGWEIAGALISLASCEHLRGRTPSFTCANDRALADIRRLADLDPDDEWHPSQIGERLASFQNARAAELLGN